jgi:hypothetical protein
VALLRFAFLEHSTKDKQNQGVWKDFPTFIADKFTLRLFGVDSILIYITARSLPNIDNRHLSCIVYILLKSLLTKTLKQ